MDQTLALDVGGTKIEICLLNEQLAIVRQEIVPTAQLAVGSLRFFDDFFTLVQSRLTPETRRVTVAMKGMMRDGVVVQGALFGGRVNFPLRVELAKRCGRAVAIDNDVVCMAHAEARLGRGKGASSFVLVNLGTGVRLVYVRDGVVVAGFSNNAGEISERRVTVPEFGHEVWRTDDLVAGRGIQKIYKKITGSAYAGEEALAIWTLKGRDHARGNAANKAITIFSRELAVLFQEISYFYNPERIVITGGARQSASVFLPDAVAQYRANTFDFFYPAQIVLSELDHQAALGSALLA